MQKQELSQKIQEALKSSCKVQLTFRNNDFDGPFLLLGLDKMKDVSLEATERLRIHIATRRYRWMNDFDRIVTVVLNEGFRSNQFVDWLAEDIENIKVL